MSESERIGPDAAPAFLVVLDALLALQAAQESALAAKDAEIARLRNLLQRSEPWLIADSGTPKTLLNEVSAALSSTPPAETAPAQRCKSPEHALPPDHPGIQGCERHPESAQGERIVAAAIRQDGVVFTGPHHHQIIRYMVPMLGIKTVSGEQGFVTSQGRYVDRKEGMLIARAAAQTGKGKDTLFSEDLWSVPDWFQHLPRPEPAPAETARAGDCHGHLVVALQKAQQQKCVEPGCSEPAPPYCARHRGDWLSRMEESRPEEPKEESNADVERDSARPEDVGSIGRVRGIASAVAHGHVGGVVAAPVGREPSRGPVAPSVEETPTPPLIEHEFMDHAAALALGLIARAECGWTTTDVCHYEPPTPPAEEQCLQPRAAHAAPEVKR